MQQQARRSTVNNFKDNNFSSFNREEYNDVDDGESVSGDEGGIDSEQSGSISDDGEGGPSMTQPQAGDVIIGINEDPLASYGILTFDDFTEVMPCLRRPIKIIFGRHKRLRPNP